MRAVAAVAASALVAAVRAQQYISDSGLTLPGPFAAWMCQPVLQDTEENKWAFDLSPLSKLSLTGSGAGYTWSYAICGVPTTACTPASQDAVLQPYSALSQVWGGNPPAGNCPNAATGQPSPCTSTCKPAAQGAPRFSLINAKNASVGVALTFLGVRPAPRDGGTCGADPVTGSQLPRTAIIQTLCDPTVPAGTVTFVDENETPECTYIIRAKSAAGCPTVADTAYPLPPPGPAIPSDWTDAPLAPYLVRPSWPISGGGVASFDLSSLWTAGKDVTFTNTTTGTTYAFAIAGSGASVCAPQSWLPTRNRGEVVMFASGGAPVGDCLLTNGSMVPCTAPCHVLATGAPFITLTAPSNPGRGGLTLQWTGLVLNGDEGGACAIDPASGIPLPTKVTLQLQCGSQPGVTVLGAQTMGCTTIITAQSLSACTT